MGAAAPLLSVRNLSVDFKTHAQIVKAVRGVSFDVGAGETLAVVGESGSGKSVTAYAVLQILDRTGKVSSGEVIYRGQDLLRLPARTVRDMRGRELAIVFQNPQSCLNPIRAVGEQISDVLLAHTDSTRAGAKRRAIELLDLVRIRQAADRYSAYPFELSGGMCQRVMIAMAIACRPKLLIADEPTTGLDVTTQKVTMDLIAELCREFGMGAILITHDLGLASEYANRIVVMKDGKIVEENETGLLLGHPQEPYTKRLIAATPRPDSTITGLLPSGDPEFAELIAFNAKTETGPADATAADSLLDVHDLSKVYGGSSTSRRFLSRFFGRGKGAGVPNEKAVDGISLVLKPGESIGLVGESGCGKTTTSRIIARLIDLTGGSVDFKGHRISDLSANDFVASVERKNIQLVFQDPAGSLNPRFTAFASIADPIKNLLAVGSPDELRARVQRAADLAGLPRHLLDRFPHQLSGGQKARVGIARAISVEPDLLILDEPTSALDVSVQAVVLNQLHFLRHKLNLSFLFVSHDLNVVRLLCEYVIVMKQGKVVEEGQTKDVFASPKTEYTRTLLAAIPQLKTVPAVSLKDAS